MSAGATRKECRRLIVGMMGRGGLEAFLKASQPAFGDRTGEQILRESPAELLRRLRDLEGEQERGAE